MATRHRWKLDNKLTAMMVEDMIFDPILAAKVILQIKVPPHEELRIAWMWSKYFTIDDSGFSTGKSFTFAVVAALRCVLFPNRICGIISKTFSQGKLIFQNFDRWYSTSKIFRSCVKHTGGKQRLTHGNDVWTMQTTCNGEARVLPPDFMRDAERVRSERWSDGFFDEWTVFGNLGAFNKTLIGRVSKENSFQGCPVRQNHIHLGSTPSFTYAPAYQVVKKVAHQIEQGNQDYGRFSCNYRHVPDTREWKFLVDRKTIFHMQTVLPPGVIKGEIDGLWQKDSGSFYSSYDIQQVRYQSLLPTLIREQEKDILIAGMDVARGGSSAQSQRGDDFALTVLMLRGNDVPRHCFTIRFNNVTAEQMAGVVHKWHRALNLSMLVFDPGGGGLFVADDLRKEQQLIDGNYVTVMPIDDMYGGSFGQAFHIMTPFRRSQFLIEKMEGKMASDSVLVNKMHVSFQATIQNKQVLLAGNWLVWDELGLDAWDTDSKREHLNNASNLSETERIAAEMDLSVCQLMSVDVERDEDKQPLIDRYGMYKFAAAGKKDSAYSLCYAHYGVKLWRWRETSDYNESQESGLSVFAAAPL